MKGDFRKKGVREICFSFTLRKISLEEFNIDVQAMPSAILFDAFRSAILRSLRLGLLNIQRSDRLDSSSRQTPNISPLSRSLPRLQPIRSKLRSANVP